MHIRPLLPLVTLLAATLAAPGTATSASTPQPPALASPGLQASAAAGVLRPDRAAPATALRNLRRVLATDPQNLAAVRDAYRDAMLAGFRQTGRYAGPDRAAADDGSGNQALLYAIPTGDLDGDGAGDVVEVRYTYRETDVVTGSTEFVARRGRDGTELWRRTVVGWADGISGRVGPTGGAGVIGATVEYTPPTGDDTDAGLYVWRIGYFGLAGDGTVAWQHDFDQTVVLHPPLVDTTGVIATAVFDAAPGAADDLLYERYSSTYTFVAAALLGNGATGALTPVGPPEAEAEVWGVPDLSSDGLGDVVWPAQAHVAAYRAVDGELLWVNTDVPAAAWAYVFGVGDVTGDGRNDVAVTLSGDASGGVPFAVLSGADGTEVWRGHGLFPFRLGDLDGNGKAEVLTIDLVRGTPNTWGVRIIGYADTGAVRYDVTRSLPWTDEAAALFARPADVQPDGIDDIGYQVVVADPATGGYAVDSGVLDGRTGAQVHATWITQPMSAVIDGTGEDFVHIGPGRGGAAKIIAVQGDTGASLWESTWRGDFPGTFPFLGFAVFGGELTADRCADLVMDVFGRDGMTVLVVDGADGHLLWGSRIRYDGTPERVPPVQTGPIATRCASTL